jgi:hypothetical protein
MIRRLLKRRTRLSKEDRESLEAERILVRKKALDALGSASNLRELSDLMLERIASKEARNAHD